MHPDYFEQLVSRWLDEPNRPDLRAELDAALREQPELAPLLMQWQRLQALLRPEAATLDNVNWARVSARISAAIDRATQDDQEVALDRLLRRLPSGEDRVDWARLHQRISTAIGGAAPAAAHSRLYRWLAGTAVAAAAAAAVLIAFLPEPAPVQPAGVARATLVGPEITAGGVAVARIAGPAENLEQPQRLFLVDPDVRAVPTDGPAGYF